MLILYNALKECDDMKEEIYMFDAIEQRLISEREFTETNYEIIRKKYIKNDLIDSDRFNRF